MSYKICQVMDEVTTYHPHPHLDLALFIQTFLLTWEFPSLGHTLNSSNDREQVNKQILTMMSFAGIVFLLQSVSLKLFHKVWLKISHSILGYYFLITVPVT